MHSVQLTVPDVKVKVTLQVCTVLRINMVLDRKTEWMQ